MASLYDLLFEFHNDGFDHQKALRINSKNINSLINKSSTQFAIETKYDGNRILYQGGQEYGITRAWKKLIVPGPIQESLKNFSNCIFDGELIHKENPSYNSLPYLRSKEYLSNRNEITDYEYIIFDIIYCGDKGFDITKDSWEVRRHYLTNVLKLENIAPIIKMVNGSEISIPLFESLIKEGDEGLIIIPTDRPYGIKGLPGYYKYKIQLIGYGVVTSWEYTKSKIKNGIGKVSVKIIRDKNVINKLNDELKIADPITPFISNSNYILEDDVDIDPNMTHLKDSHTFATSFMNNDKEAIRYLIDDSNKCILQFKYNLISDIGHVVGGTGIHLLITPK